LFTAVVYSDESNDKSIAHTRALGPLSTCAASEGALMLYDGGADTSAMRVVYIA